MPDNYEFQTRYLLSKHIPAMNRGFIIKTDTGEFDITADEATSITALVKRLLQKRLQTEQKHRSKKEPAHGGAASACSQASQKGQRPIPSVLVCQSCRDPFYPVLPDQQYCVDCCFAFEQSDKDELAAPSRRAAASEAAAASSKFFDSLRSDF